MFGNRLQMIVLNCNCSYITTTNPALRALSGEDTRYHYKYFNPSFNFWKYRIIMKHSPVIHPFLFALFSVLFLYSHNIEEMSVADLPLPTAVVLVLAALIWILLRIILKDARKAGIITTIGLLLFFSYGHLFNISQSVLHFMRHRYLLSIYLLIFLLPYETPNIYLPLNHVWFESRVHSPHLTTCYSIIIRPW